MSTVNEAIARLRSFQAWAEQTRRALAGDAELTEAAESTIRTGERVHQQIVMRAADAESGGKWH